MNNIGILSLANRLSKLFPTLMLIGLLVLPGCGGSSNQDPSGLYKSGTGSLGGVSGLTDIIGFVHNNRIIAFSVAAHTLIDGTIISVDEHDYTATVNVYKDGVRVPGSATMNGFVTNGSSISGTLNGRGDTAGNFSLTFDLLYGRGATRERFSTKDPLPSWGGPVMMVIDAVTTGNFSTYSNATVYQFTSVKSPPTTTCVHNGTISISNSAVNIYSLQESISSNFSCDLLVDTNYSGFTAMVDNGGTDNTLLYATTNGSYSVFAVLSR